MNEVTIFNNEEFGEIRTLEAEDGKVLFCGKDVAEAIGYKDTRHAVSAFPVLGIETGGVLHEGVIRSRDHR